MINRVRIADAVDKSKAPKPGAAVRVGDFKVVLSYTSKPSGLQGKELRWYMLGHRKICNVEVYEEGHHGRGKFICFLDGNLGNGGQSFQTEREMHGFIIGYLQGEDRA